METLVAKFQKFKNFDLEESKTSNLLFHLIQYYQFDSKKLEEHKELLLTKKGINEIINIIQLNEAKLFEGNFDFKEMVPIVHKRIELLDEEESFKYINNFVKEYSNTNLKKN